MRILLVFCFLTGCASTPAANFSQVLAGAEAADDAIVVSATSLLNSGAITSAQAKKILTITDGLNATLTLANNAYQAGNISSANAQIATVTSALTLIQSCLAASSAKQSLDTCLSPVSTP
jgi:hypothetical protein